MRELNCPKCGLGTKKNAAKLPDEKAGGKKKRLSAANAAAKAQAAFLVLLLAGTPSLFAKKAKKGKAAQVQSAAAKAPDWTTGVPSAYPESRYMTAVGSSQFEKSAEKDALSALAAIFSQIVSSTEDASRTVAQDSSGSVSRESGYAQKVSARVDESELIGAEIKERFFDGKKYYALAVMDKVEAAKLYKASVEANNKEIERLESHAAASGNSLEAFMDLFVAQGLAEWNQTLLERLFVINADLAKSIEKKSAQDLRSKRAEIAGGIPVRAEVSGDRDSAVFKALSELLTDFGFRLSSDSGSRYSLSAEFSLEQKPSSDKKSIQTFYALSCVLKDSAASGVLWSESFKGRASSFNESDSYDRALNAVKKKIEGDVSGSLESFLRGSKK